MSFILVPSFKATGIFFFFFFFFFFAEQFLAYQGRQVHINTMRSLVSFPIAINIGVNLSLKSVHSQGAGRGCKNGMGVLGIFSYMS